MEIRSKVPTKVYRDNWDEIFKVKGLNETPVKTEAERARTHMIAPEFKPFVSDDGTIINTKRALRSHMKARNLAHADDFKEHWKIKAKERDLMTKGIHPSQKAERIAALRDAYEHARDKARYFR